MKRRVVAMTVMALAVILALSACGSSGGAAHTATGKLPPKARVGAPSPLGSVNWASATFPASTCRASAPITLDNGVATLRQTGFGPVNSSGADPDLVQVTLGNIVYGTVANLGAVAVIDVACTNNGGTADGQIRFANVVFTGPAASPRAVGVLLAQQPTGESPDHAAIVDPPSFTAGRLKVTEHWYGPNDPTASASGLATTIWAYSGGRFRVVKTVVARHPAS